MKKKRLTAITAIILCILALLTVTLWQSGLLSKIFKKKDYVSFPPVHLFPVNYNEDIFRDEEYLKLDRRLNFIDGIESRLIDSPEDASGNTIAVFFLKYFECITLGDSLGYCEMFTDEYRSRFPDKESFTMQKIYEMTAERESDVAGEKPPSGVIVHRFKVSYKIKENNGSFKNDLASDTVRPQIYRIYEYPNGKILINSISDIIPK